MESRARWMERLFEGDGRGAELRSRLSAPSPPDGASPAPAPGAPLLLFHFPCDGGLGAEGAESRGGSDTV